MTRLASLAAALLLAACAAPSKPTESRPALPIGAPDGLAPLVVKWAPGPAAPGGLALTARIEFRLPLEQPVQVAVTVPPGVRLLSGAAAFEARSPAGLAPIELPYRFAVDAGATGEILLTADLRSEGAGLHGKAAWRVGAPPPAAQELQASPPDGPRVQINGRDFGPSTPIR